MKNVEKPAMQLENAFEDSGSLPPLGHNLHHSEVKVGKELGFIEPLPEVPPELNPSRYYCCPEWHFARLRRTPFAGLLYSFVLRLSRNSGLFHGSVVGLAEYFQVSRSKVQRAIDALVELGFFELVAREAFQPTVYRPISHKDWATKHPGKCAVKESFPWSGEDGDKLGVRLWNASGGKVKFQPYQLAALRNTALTDDEIEAAFGTLMAAEQARREARGWNGRWGAVQPRFLRWLTGQAHFGELKALGLQPYCNGDR